MGLFGMIKNAVGNHAGIKVIQNGSDILINRHTRINTLNVHSALRERANELLKHLFLNEFMEDMTEAEAAILKLSVFYKAAEESENDDLMELIGDSISTIREVGDGKIRAAVSMQVRGDTGS